MQFLGCLLQDKFQFLNLLLRFEDFCVKVSVISFLLVGVVHRLLKDGFLILAVSSLAPKLGRGFIYKTAERRRHLV
jgi:hypothetical protein